MPGILVVEDDENLNRGITFSLKKSGYEVFSAESMKKAKRIASDNNVDVILHALGYGTSSMACVSLSYAVGLVAMLGYSLTPEWGKLRRKAKELGDAVTAETEPTL